MSPRTLVSVNVLWKRQSQSSMTLLLFKVERYVLTRRKACGWKAGVGTMGFFLFRVLLVSSVSRGSKGRYGELGEI